MAIIEKEVELVGSKGKEKVTGLFDSGATYSCIEKELAQQLEMIIPLPTPLPFETAKKGEKVEAEEAVRLDFYLDGYRFSDEFFVLPDFSEKLIIGTTTMQKWRFKLDFEREEVIIDPRVTRLRLLKAVETESEMMREKKS
ncbi:MAG: retropepsin-like aspartic protease [archaeon]|nr:retropepsin-like aspartic protease [archaeon]